MSTRARAAAVAAVAIAAGITVAAVLIARSGASSPPPPRAGISADASLVPRAAPFGEQVVATVDALVDSRAVRPSSLDLRGSFAPYVPAASVATTRQDVGRVSRVRFRIALRCLDPACLPPDSARGGGPATVRMPTAQLRFVRADGRPGTLAVRWPALTVASRLPAAVAAAVNPAKQPPYRATFAPPPVTYAYSPTLLVWLLATGGALLLAGAAALAVLAARPALLRGRLARWRRRGPQGLERALLLLRRAQERGSESERRKALELLSVELRRSGESELAGSATTLAWAEPPPAQPATDGLAEAVGERLRAEGNGRARG